MVFHVIKTYEDTRGKSLEMEWEQLPGADGTPLNIHPTAEETYRVLEGQVEINVNGKWILLQAGEELRGKAGVTHTFRNATEKYARV